MNRTIELSRSGLAISRYFMLVLVSVTLAACGGGGGGSPPGNTGVGYSGSQQADVYYTYPANGQTGVSPDAPVVVSFMKDVGATVVNFQLTGPNGDVTFTLSTADGGKSVILTPSQPLATDGQYTLTLHNIKSTSGAAELPDGLTFTTRPALDGPLSSRETSATFEVSDMSPDGTTLPFVDFSSVDLTLTQPVDPQTAVYGTTVTLTQDGKTVPATLLVKGNAMTIDPTDDLTPGTPATVTVTTGVKNIAGTPLAVAFTKTVTPKDTMPRSTLVQQAAAAGSGSCMDSDVTTSPLTGQAINCVPVIGKLLGNTTVSKLAGNVYAQLAYAVNFPNITPLRIPKNSLLQGNPLQVNIGGHVPAGFNSGDVTVTFLSDANGYLMPNPYTDNPNAPKKLVLTMDVQFNTANPRANGAFTQNLMHVKLVGTAITDTNTGSLIVNAVGIVEPKVLGVENAYGVLSFHMASYPDQVGRPKQPPADQTPPTLASWQPGDNADKQLPGDPIILSFSEPLDQNSIAAGDDLTLMDTSTGKSLPFTWYIDGVDLVIKPKTPLAYSDTYQVAYNDHLTDLAGNGAEPNTLSFTMPAYDTGNPQSPLVLAAYPGFPCVTTGMNLANGDAGRCAGGKSSDDDLPLARLPSNRPIHVTFSQVIDPSTVNGNTFEVDQVDSSGNKQSVVSGQVKVNGRVLTFTPDQPWQVGAYYDYTLKSVSSSPNCGSDSICDNRGYPLQTELLAQTPGDAPAPTAGGPNLVIYFQGVAATDDVMQYLRNRPTSDVNANFLHDSSEGVPSDSSEVLKNSAHIIPNPNGSGGGTDVASANVGCAVGSTCPDQQYGYITGNLNVDIVGYKTAAQAKALDEGNTPQTVLDNGGVLVYIYPTRLVVSTATVYTKLTTLVGVLASADPAATGPQLMRIRYTCNAADGNCKAPDYGRVKGWIVSGTNGPEFLANLNLYLDTPKLDPTVSILGIVTHLTHNLHSYPLKLELAGAVTFLNDGRLQIAQISQNPLNLDVNLGNLPVGSGSIHIVIPAGGTDLNYVTAPIKH